MEEIVWEEGEAWARYKVLRGTVGKGSRKAEAAGVVETTATAGDIQDNCEVRHRGRHSLLE